MSSSSAEDAVNTRSVPRATVVRAVLTVAISALLTGVLFSYFYIEVFNAPEPHRLPVAVVGADASRLQDAVGDGYRLVQMTRREEGLERLSRHEVYGVVSLDGEARSVELYYTSVDGTSVLAYMRPVAQRVSERSGMVVRVTNMTPEVAANASPGRSVFFAVFGTALTGFVLSQRCRRSAPRLGCHCEPGWQSCWGSLPSSACWYLLCSTHGSPSHPVPSGAAGPWSRSCACPR